MWRSTQLFYWLSMIFFWRMRNLILQLINLLKFIACVWPWEFLGNAIVHDGHDGQHESCNTKLVSYISERFRLVWCSQKQLLIVIKNRILFENSNIKNSFLNLFSMKVPCTRVHCKNSQIILHIFNCFLWYFTKNTLKCIKIALKHNLFSEQILKNLFFS